jgi:hypothetical protein
MRGCFPLRRLAAPKRKQRLLARIVILAAASSLVAFAGASEAAAPAPAQPSLNSLDGCPKVILYYSRGSGQKLTQDANGMAFPTAPADPADERGLSSPGSELYHALAAQLEADNVGSIANGYPAIAVTRKVFGKKLVRIFVSGKYKASVSDGIQAAASNLVDAIRLCPRSKFVLGGFSQGSQVARETAAVLANRQLQGHVAAIILFGDPLFSPTEQFHEFGGFSHSKSGILRLRLAHTSAPQIAASYPGKVFSWCHPLDIICQASLKSRGTAHGTYGADAPTAATKLVTLIHATAHTYSVQGTCNAGACALAEWTGPGMTSYNTVAADYEGKRLDIVCQTTGQTIKAANGRTSAIWDELADGAFVPDLYVDTPGVGAYSAHIPTCHNLDTVGARP